MPSGSPASGASSGEGLDIAVDAQTRYTAADLAEVIAYCEDYRVYWLEEPFPPDATGAYRDLKERIRVPVAAGENHYTRQEFRGALRSARDRRGAGGLHQGRRHLGGEEDHGTWRRPGTCRRRLTRATPC